MARDERRRWHDASRPCSARSQVELDLLDAESWKAAVEGCDYVQHIASPFIIGDIDEAEMIRTAVEVRAAAVALPTLWRRWRVEH